MEGVKWGRQGWLSNFVSSFFLVWVDGFSGGASSSFGVLAFVFQWLLLLSVHLTAARAAI
jgi:hypothetical protein